MTLVVGNTKIPAHKAVLSARRSYFEKLFAGGFSEAKQPEIELQVPLDAFKVILRFIYTHSVECASIRRSICFGRFLRFGFE